MAKYKNKLELTWIGKDKRLKLEPRILLEESDKFYHAKHRFTERFIFSMTEPISIYPKCKTFMGIERFGIQFSGTDDARLIELVIDNNKRDHNG